MGRLTLRSPATWMDCLACAGGRAFARKAAIWQCSNGDAVAILDDDTPVAVAYLVPIGEGGLEFCLSIRLEARPYMTALVRLAHSTLSAFRENGAVVFCHVSEANRAGLRMARLVGFRHCGGTLWQLNGDGDG